MYIYIKGLTNTYLTMQAFAVTHSFCWNNVNPRFPTATPWSSGLSNNVAYLSAIFELKVKWLIRMLCNKFLLNKTLTRLNNTHTRTHTHTYYIIIYRWFQYLSVVFKERISCIALYFSLSKWIRALLGW